MMKMKRKELDSGTRSILFMFFAVIIPSIGLAQSPPDLVVDGQPVYLSGSHEYRNVHVVNGGMIRISQPNGNPTVVGMLKLVCDEIIIDASSGIYGESLGGVDAPGTGFPPDPNRGGNGGRYGGHGGANRAALQGITYGTLRGLDIYFGSPGTEGATIITGSGSFVFGGDARYGGAGIEIHANDAKIYGGRIQVTSATRGVEEKG